MKTNLDLGSQILSDITVFNKYAKFVPTKERRETWEEIVTRNMEMHIKSYPLLREEIIENYQYVYDKKVLPSMRSLQFAGKPIDINPARIYNCCYLPIDDYRAFSETMFLLLGGTGVGYSVQFHHVEKLPEISKPVRSRRFLVSDSIEGWADAVKALVKSYYGKGPKPKFDFSDIRPKGARLVTAGGKAPGPEPLKECLSKLEMILDRKENGEKLTPNECHDMLCFIANAVLAGGIRRAAMISGFSFNDEQMLACKSSNIPSKILSKEHPKYTSKDGLLEDTTKLILTVQQGDIIYKDVVIHIDVKTDKFWDIEQHNFDGTLGWWVCNEQRGRANNSAVVLRHKVKQSDFFNLWKKIEDSNSGEPGIYLSNDKDWFTNPCCEIALRPFQFCNLCEINASDLESQEDYNKRAKVAAFIGTLQAGYTDFHYLRDIWRRTTEKDALIGVGMTGIGSGVVTTLDMNVAAEIVKVENERVAKLIDVNVAARTTCVKPSGTSSCVLGTSSGIHAWHAPFYVRRMRVGKNEALYTYLSIYHPELIEDDKFRPTSQAVISIPIKAPQGAILRNEAALSLLERVKLVSDTWVKSGHRDGNNTHNVSATISIRKEFDEKGNITFTEWEEVGKWMWKNRECYNGLSVLNYDGGTYVQAPFEDITEEKYNEMLNHLHSIDISRIIEVDDATDLKAEAACVNGACEVY